MIQARDVGLQFGAHVVLDGASLSLDTRTKAALVGSNGSGKSTLLKVLAGELAPDRGTVVRAKSLRVAYLPQHLTADPVATPRSVADQAFVEEHRAAAAWQAATAVLERRPDDRTALAEIAALDRTLHTGGYWERDALITRTLAGLGFDRSRIDRPLREFSGGWRMRAFLAGTLLRRAGVVLLDEPTNYLDSESRIWLARFVADYDGGVLLVAHDRAFMDEACRVIVELDNGRVRRYSGPYSRYAGRRREEVEHLERAAAGQAREIARQEAFIARFRATSSKARQVQSRIRALEKIERIQLPDYLRTVSMHAPAVPGSSKVMLRLRGLGKSYAERRVLDGIDLELERGARLAIVGRNGAGKTTLLRIVAGTLERDDGEVVFGSGVKCAYFDQEDPEQLDPRLSVLDYATGVAAPDHRGRIRDLLGAFHFSGDAVDRSVGTLSGGERTRLVLAGLMLSDANLLLLDEPTNHLDLHTKDVLARTLATYQGGVIVVSHDRDVLRRVATDVLALWPPCGTKAPRWRRYPGGFEEFERRAFDEVLGIDPGERKAVTRSRPAGGREAYQRSKERRGELARLRKEEARLLDVVERQEAEIERIGRELSDPAIYRDGAKARELSRALKRHETERDVALQRWEAVSTALEAR